MLLAVGTIGWVTPSNFGRTDKGKLLQDAEKYASGLKKEDKLPGFNHSEHGHLITSVPWVGGPVSYPAHVTVRAWKDGDESAYYTYDLDKESPDANWKLLKAEHLDKDDKMIEKLYPK
jgi:hypothetical protein